MRAPTRTSAAPHAADPLRELGEADRAAFLAFARREPERMLAPRMNVEAFGMRSETLRLWGAFTPAGLAGVLLRFRNTVVAVDQHGQFGSAFAALIDTQSDVAGVRGTIETAAVIQAHLHRYACADWEESHFLQLTRRPECDPSLLARARLARESDLDRLAELYKGAGVMFRSRDNLAAKVAGNRVFFVEAPSASLCAPIVACALINVEGNDAGMIGGVYTHPSYRGRGYATACVAALCEDLQRTGKTPCLYYENPAAGRVYRRMGFEPSGRWAVLYLATRAQRG